MIARIDGKAARLGGPSQAASLGLPVKKDLGEPAAVIVAGAEKQDALRTLIIVFFHASFRGALWAALAWIYFGESYAAGKGRTRAVPRNNGGLP